MSKIEGLPEGWEAVAFRQINEGEWFLNAAGKPQQHKALLSGCHYLVIRRVEPVCTWQHGVFADVWIAEDANRSLWIYSHEPSAEEEGWVCRDNNGYCSRLNRKVMLNPPVFRADLLWTERIQAVGPTIEATLKGAT